MSLLASPLSSLFRRGIKVDLALVEYAEKKKEKKKKKKKKK
jgi:hypothetical protein